MPLFKFLASKVKPSNPATNHDTPKIIERPRKYQTLCVDQRFPAMGKASGCVLSEIHGVLPKDPLHRSLLRTEHLRRTPGTLAAIRVQEESTHQFWAWTQKRHGQSSPCVLVYCIQVDLRHFSQKSWGETFLRLGRKQEASIARQNAQSQTDRCAIWINKSLASIVASHSNAEMLNTVPPDEFWCLVIEQSYKSFWNSRMADQNK